MYRHPQKPEEGIRLLGATVTGTYVLPYVDAGI